MFETLSKIPENHTSAILKDSEYYQSFETQAEGDSAWLNLPFDAPGGHYQIIERFFSRHADGLWAIKSWYVFS